MRIKIRKADISDLEAIAAVEVACFPPAEAASKNELEQRLKCYSDHFLLMFDGDKLVSFVDGFVTDSPDLTDEMYANAGMHNENGSWQMIFGVNTLPEYRRRGYAERLITQLLSEARSQGRSGAVLTCKKELIHYYERFGFVNEGITSQSVHGGAVWYQMRAVFDNI